MALSTVLLHSRSVKQGRAYAEGEGRKAVQCQAKREEAQQWLSGNGPNMALLINLIPSASSGLLSQTFRCVKITLS